MTTGNITVEGYGIAYPAEVAGHGSVYRVLEDLVHTVEDADVMFDGRGLERDVTEGDTQLAGYTATNRAIGEVMKDAAFRDDRRRPVSEVADNATYGNVTLRDANAIRLVLRNERRKDVTVTNQSNANVYVGKDTGLIPQGPNTVYLPGGAARTFTHKDQICVVGAAGQVIDWVEENYG